MCLIVKGCLGYKNFRISTASVKEAAYAVKQLT